MLPEQTSFAINLQHSKLGGVIGVDAHILIREIAAPGQATASASPHPQANRHAVATGGIGAEIAAAGAIFHVLAGGDAIEDDEIRRARGAEHEDGGHGGVEAEVSPHDDQGREGCGQGTAGRRTV